MSGRSEAIAIEWHARQAMLLSMSSMRGAANSCGGGGSDSRRVCDCIPLNHQARACASNRAIVTRGAPCCVGPKSELDGIVASRGDVTDAVRELRALQSLRGALDRRLVLLGLEHSRCSSHEGQAARGSNAPTQKQYLLAAAWGRRGCTILRQEGL